MASGLLKRYTEQAEVFYQQSIYQDSSRQLKRALHEKQQVRSKSLRLQLQQDCAWAQITSHKLVIAVVCPLQHVTSAVLA